MKNINKASHFHLPAQKEGRNAPEAPTEPFTPGMFFIQAGIVIGVCLALGWLAPLLMAVISR